MVDTDHIVLEKDCDVARVWLNRPHKKNAVTVELLHRPGRTRRITRSVTFFLRTCDSSRSAASCLPQFLMVRGVRA